jgi:hypothetical protein
VSKSQISIKRHACQPALGQWQGKKRPLRADDDSGRDSKGSGSKHSIEETKLRAVSNKNKLLNS